MAPHNAYRCAGDDKWVTIAVANDEEWARLVEAIGEPQWTNDPKFSDALARYKHQDELDQLVEEWTRSREQWEITRTLQAAGVACGPVLNAKDLLLDPHLKERGFYRLQTMPPEAEGVGTRPYVGMPWRLSKAEPELRMSCPTLGRDNDYIFRELLGLSSNEVEELAREGSTSTDPLPGQTRPMAPLNIEAQLRNGDLAGYDPDYKSILGLPVDESN
jgi:crotonobetainyl-CoA:carnitine CoA-transferase CaiB-like acyl-CoA transferase